MPPSTKKTYGTQRSSSPASHLDSSPAPSKRKRPLIDQLSFDNAPPRKKQQLSSKPKVGKSASKPTAKGKDKGKQKQLTQLHFCLDTPILRTCPLCNLSYTRGAPDDEILHKSHCARVQRGLEWGKEEAREVTKAGVEEVASSIKLKNGSKGRIIRFRADVGGKIGAKLALLLQTINLTLSSPSLTPATLQASKVYLFLITIPPLTSTSTRREKIVGCVIAQRISTAMAIVKPSDTTESTDPNSSEPSSSDKLPTSTLIPVDVATNLYVHPTPLPTPLGIPRLFVSSSHRRLGIATHLLTIAAETFILGCPLNPVKGDVAFSQPTGAGKAVLEKWGKGGVRIYEE